MKKILIFAIVLFLQIGLSAQGKYQDITFSDWSNLTHNEKVIFISGFALGNLLTIIDVDVVYKDYKNEKSEVDISENINGIVAFLDDMAESGIFESTTTIAPILCYKFFSNLKKYSDSKK